VLRRTIKRIKVLPYKKKEPYLSFSKVLGFCPDRIELYQEAVTHRSSSVRSSKGRWVNNERLEFLGDAILDAIVADILYKEFEYKKEGFLTSMRSRIVQRETLNKLAVELGLDKLIVSSTRNLAHNTNIYGDALEAIIGAIYLDQGYRVAKSFVFETMIKQHLTMEKVIKREVDFKSRLIEWGQKNKIEVSFNLVDSFYDEQNNPIFKSTAVVGGLEIGNGTGYSKKESHQLAAKEAIQKMREDRSLQQTILDNTHNYQTQGNNLVISANEPNFDELQVESFTEENQE
jgi:ribonuclease-3